MTTPSPLRVSQADAANWLIRSALPRYLDMTDFAREAARLRELPPWQGDLHDWNGATALVDTVVCHFDRLRDALVDKMRSEGRRIVYLETPTLEFRQQEFPGLDERCAFGAEALRPHQLGDLAYRAICAVIDATMLTTEYFRQEEARIGLRLAWQRALQTLTDRATVRGIARQPPTCSKEQP